MKRLLSLVLVLLLMFSVVACSKPAEENDVVETSAEKSSQSEEQEETAQDVEKEEANTSFTLTDNAGRTVEFEKPVDTAVVALRYNSELIRACGAIDKVIAVDKNTAQDREYWAQFDPENVIGKNQKELNYEKIAELNPDVVILPKNGKYEEAEQKLEPFGIKVFVISGYDTSDFKNQIENIGKLFATEEKAQEFYNYFNDKLESIKTNVKDEDKKTVYFETTKTLNSTLPGDYFYNMLDYAGANNIFATDNENIDKGAIDPEEVVNRNPDVIIKLITPSEAIKGTGLYMPPTKEDFKAAYEEIISRPGWENINAIKNKQVYFMTQFSHGGASKLVGTIYVANSLYPEQTKDINYKDVFKDWMEKYQGFKNIDGHFYSADELE